MRRHRGGKPTLAIGLLLAIVLDTAGQLLWKYAVATLPMPPSTWTTLAAVLAQPLFLLVAGVFLLQLFNWLNVLGEADLSYAQPITSLSYITVLVLSAWLFGERIGPLKAAGIVCILAGVWMVSRGRQLTRSREPAP